MDQRPNKSRLAPALIVAGILSAMLAVYVVGYVLLGGRGVPPAQTIMFSSEWKARIFTPAPLGQCRSATFGVL